MPTYEYRCVKCSKHTEVVQSFTADPLTVCPSCGGELKKVFGSIGVVFKGSGFYKTDNRRSTPAGSRAGSGSDAPKDKEQSGNSTPSSSGDGASPAAAPSSDAGGSSSKNSSSKNSSSKNSSSKDRAKAKASETKSA